MPEEKGITQGELFSRFNRAQRSHSLKQRFKPKLPGKVAFSYENLVFISILSIMTLVLSFSLGVEHGKKWSTEVQLASQESLVIADNAAEEVDEASSKPVEITPPVRAETPASQPAESESPKRFDHPYTIQLITFNRKETAEKELGQLKINGYEPFISTRNDYYEVCVGQYPDSNSAKPVLTRLKQSKWYHDAFVRKLK